MTIELTVAGAEQALKGINIPPRPALLVDINNELRKDDPDLKNVAAIIARDVGVSAAVLKTINSPLFGLRSKVGNPLQAVQLLGANNVRNIVTGLSLRAAMGGSAQAMERFWEKSEKVAGISVYLCSILPRSPREEVYTFGIFHDCGIPILMQRFSDYQDTLALAGKGSQSLATLEDERHGTNHAVLGYMVAKSWGLPPSTCEAILRHHDPAVFSPNDTISPLARTLIAINFLAEHLHDTMTHARGEGQWASVGDLTLHFLGVSQSEYEDIREDVEGLAA